MGEFSEPSNKFGDPADPGVPRAAVYYSSMLLRFVSPSLDGSTEERASRERATFSHVFERARCNRNGAVNRMLKQPGI